jgi:hypothetical protein
VQAEARDRGLLHALARLVGLTLAAVGAAFVLTMLLAGQADAAATPGAGQPSAASITDDEGDAASTAQRPALWADADALSAVSTRRAAAESSAAVSSRPSLPSLDERTGNDPAPATAPHVGIGVTSTAVGSLGTSGGAPDAGPSITQLAVLAAALLGVLWLSRRLLASELSWQSTFLTLSIERPG